MDTILTPRALARTYEHPSYSDPWDAVVDYQRVQEYAAKFPEAGRTRVGNALDLPPSRVRGWLDGGKPDCVRGVHRAVEKGWFDARVNSEAFLAFNELVAAVYSGGSIDSQRYVPTFTDESVTGALDTLGVEWVHRERDAERAAEVVASNPGSLLGRALSVLGAPVGTKRYVEALPPYLEAAPGDVREQFATVYLRNRGHERESHAIQFRENRPDVYLDALAAFLEATLGTNVTRSEKNVYIAAVC